MKAYCANLKCGSITLFESVKPKFCGACGQSFDAVFKQVAAAQKEPEPLKYIHATPRTEPRNSNFRNRNNYESVSDHAEIPDFSDFEIAFTIKETQPKVLTLGDLSKMGADDSQGRPKGNALDADQIMARMRADGQNRNASEVGDQGGE